MHFSLSSLFMSLIMVSILILIFNFFLTKKSVYRFFRMDFLTVLLIAIILRILIPAEFFFTISIYSTEILTVFYDFLIFNDFHGFTVLHLLIIIWIIGMVVQAVRYILKIKKLNGLIRGIKQTAVLHHTSEFIQDPGHKDYAVYFTDVVSTPMVLGFSNSLFLPNDQYTDTEMNNILRHEMQHITNKDILIKHLFNIISIIYWWFYPIYILKRQIDLFLEMRIDVTVNEKANVDEQKDYLNTLLTIQEKQHEKKSIDAALSNCIINEGTKTLTKRVHYLIAGQRKKKTSKILLSLAFIIPLLSNSIIFEAWYTETEDTKGTYSEEEFKSKSYIIDHGDGTYDLYLDGQAFPIESPDRPEFEGIKIFKE